MIGEYPITWLITELLSVVLIVMCMRHALRQEDYKQKLFELLCFVIGSAIFEHVGVAIGGYSYDQRHIMMVGVVPLSILMIEAVIIYAAMTLFKYLDMPKWTVFWVVGFFASFQDMSLDPVYVHDAYLNNGVMSGQWNWLVKYDNNFFGIPFFNFWGWVFMSGWYASLILLGRWLYEKYKKPAIAVSYPFLAGLLLIVVLGTGFLEKLIFSLIIPGESAHEFLIIPFIREAELVQMILHYSIAIILMIVYLKRMKPIDLKKDSVIFTIPIILHLYDIIIGFGLGITRSYIPVAVVSALHFVYLFFLYRKARAGVQPH